MLHLSWNQSYIRVCDSCFGLLCFLPQIVRHGGGLGVGLAALGTARQDVYDLLKSNLYQDDAVTGTRPWTDSEAFGASRVQI